VRKFVRELLASDDGVRVDPTKKQVAGEAVSWTVRVSSEADGEPAVGTAEAVFERGKIRTLTFAPSA
jgi:hypothetical protein